jgi:hypothetical protein
MQWQPQPTIDELTARLRAAKEMRVPSDTKVARDLSHLSDPDLIRRLMAKGEADFAQFMEERACDDHDGLGGDVEIASKAKGKKPQVFRERDVRRAIAGHLKAGLSVHHTMIDREGAIVIFTGQPEPVSVAPANAWDDAL